MKLNTLVKVSDRSAKRLGRGLGSGKGKTGGRGQKGQKARGKVTVGFTGGGLPLYKKFPLLRGWGNTKITGKPVIINLDQLGNITGPINVESLIKSGLVTESEVKKHGVKILGRGKLNTKVVVSGLGVSNSAKKMIEAAGGKVE